MIAEFRKSSYAKIAKITILGSREQLCTQKSKKIKSKDELCKSLTNTEISDDEKENKNCGCKKKKNVIQIKK